MQRDLQLTFRLIISFFALTMIYLIFLSFITIYFGLGIFPIAAIAALMIGVQWFFSDRIVLWSTRTKIISKDEYPLLHHLVEDLSQKSNLPKPRIGIMDSDIPNAFATGKGSRSSVVVVSSGILKILDKDELEGVLSHELSHIRNKDVTIITLASLFSTIAWYLMQSSMFNTMWGTGYGGRQQQGGSMFVVLIVAGIVWFLSFLIIRAISRYRELAADRSGAYLTRKPLNLSRALMKIHGEIKTSSTPEIKKIEGLNAFFIIPAISGETFARFFSTHPPIEQRIKQLMRIEQEIRGSDKLE